MSLSRRQILGSTAVGLAVGGVLPSLAATPASAASSTGTSGRPLRPFPPLKDDPNGILALPEGFSYKIVTREGQTDMSFGQGKTPGLARRHRRRGRKHATGSTLIQNHELAPHVSAYGVPHIPGTVYDPGAPWPGGCTVVNTDRQRQACSAEWVGISGTVRNCAGGVTPVGHLADLRGDRRSTRAPPGRRAGQTGMYQKDHGYVFEVFPTRLGAPAAQADQGVRPLRPRGPRRRAEPAAPRLPLRGRQRPQRAVLPLDRDPAACKLGEGLAEQAQRHRRHARGDADPPGRRQHHPRRRLHHLRAARPPVQGDLDRRCPTGTRRPRRPASQFADGTVTRGKKFEGVWSNGKGCYIVNSFAFATADLPPDADQARRHGLVLRLHGPDHHPGHVLPAQPGRARARAPRPKYADLTFDGPDNVTVTPWGTLVLAEDGVARLPRAQLGPGRPDLRDRPQPAPASAPATATPTYSEFTGPTFSPDGKVLFVNIQTPGITLAITGPWQDYLR